MLYSTKRGRRCFRGNGSGCGSYAENDLDRLHDFHQDIANRGDFFPVGVVSLPTFQEQFRKSGFWEKTEGMLIIAGEGDGVLGHVEFFETVNYLDEIELSYIIYSPDDAGRGIATEAVTLLSGYLFDAKKINRIRLVIHPDNQASRRVAEKAGFTYEGVARGASYTRVATTMSRCGRDSGSEHAGALRTARAASVSCQPPSVHDRIRRL